MLASRVLAVLGAVASCQDSRVAVDAQAAANGVATASSERAAVIDLLRREQRDAVSCVERAVGSRWPALALTRRELCRLRDAPEGRTWCTARSRTVLGSRRRNRMRYQFGTAAGICDMQWQSSLHFAAKCRPLPMSGPFLARYWGPVSKRLRLARGQTCVWIRGDCWRSVSKGSQACHRGSQFGTNTLPVGSSRRTSASRRRGEPGSAALCKAYTT